MVKCPDTYQNAFSSKSDFFQNIGGHRFSCYGASLQNLRLIEGIIGFHAERAHQGLPLKSDSLNNIDLKTNHNWSWCSL